MSIVYCLTSINPLAKAVTAAHKSISMNLPYFLSSLHLGTCHTAHPLAMARNSVLWTAAGTNVGPEDGGPEVQRGAAVARKAKPRRM